MSVYFNGVRLVTGELVIEAHKQQSIMVEASWNVMTQAQKPDFVFRRKDESI